MDKNDSHSLFVGYIAWIFGFMGAHRFYFGKPITGTIWFFTLGLFFIGWIIDLLLIPAMEREADNNYMMGETNYTVAWLLLFFTGFLGLHRMYMGKWISGLLYLCTFGLFGLGILYDFWTLNSQVHEENCENCAWA
ncbi:MAG: TM2 domain-containing protein [Cellvibrionaceae bacterium]|nr:TM2 domain-containing protein [Cellvibrionaceae bacterium]